MNKKFKMMSAFSLVELMISLIVISIVTAAFAPVVTKKLKTSDMSIGSASSDYIFDETICNKSVSNCSVCVKDECVRCKIGYYLDSNSCKACSNNCTTCDSQNGCTKCEDGYYLDGTQCKSCPDGCTKCENATTCTECKENYLKSGSSCVACPNHCKTCTSSSQCSTCNDGYFMTEDKTCYKYECGNLICILTTDNDEKLSLYRYYMGDGSLSLPEGINVCYAKESCEFGGLSPTCWKANSATHTFTSQYPQCLDNPIASTYSRCNRTVCNYNAAEVMANKYSTSGWRILKKTDVDKISKLKAGWSNASIPVDPFPVFKVPDNPNPSNDADEVVTLSGIVILDLFAPP